MFLIITSLGLAQAREPLPDRPVANRLELEGTDTRSLSLGTRWSQPRPARLTANTVITASGLVLTLLTVHSVQESRLQGDLVPGQAILTGLGGGTLLLGGGALWLSTDFAVDRSGLQQGFAIRGVW